MQGDSLAWTDAKDPERNFEFKTTDLEKVWFTCHDLHHDEPLTVGKYTRPPKPGVMNEPVLKGSKRRRR